MESLERVRDQAKFWALSPRPWRKTMVWVWGSVGGMIRGRLMMLISRLNVGYRSESKKLDVLEEAKQRLKNERWF